MLYVTTKDAKDAYTAHRTLLSDCGPDGGLYLPFRMTVMDADDLAALSGKGFGQIVAERLNQFFSCQLSGWDVELAAGRYPLRGVSLNRKILIGELWHNLQWDYRHLETVLAELICRKVSPQACATSWVRIAIRIATLFALYGEMLKKELLIPGQVFDAAVPTGDLSLGSAVVYARKMGLPVANLICACNENGALWELVNHGELRGDVQAVTTVTPLADHAVPPELERLIHMGLGREEAERYSHCRDHGATYSLRPDLIQKLREGLSVAVVSGDRVSAVCATEYQTSGYILGPYTALAYGALMDFRAKTGESRPALILADRSAVCDADLVSAALRMTKEELNRLTQKG